MPHLKDEVAALLGVAGELAGEIEPGVPTLIDEFAGRLHRPELTVVVVGERNRGKSALVNALIGRPLMPVGSTRATAVPVLVRYAPGPPTARVIRVGDDQEVGGRTIDPADLATWVFDEQGRDVALVVVTADSELLAAGLEIMDTPGTGGLVAGDQARTAVALRRGDAALFVVDPYQPVSASELAFLTEVADRTDLVVFALTKVGSMAEAEWQPLLDSNRKLIVAHEPRFAGATFLAVTASVDAESDDASVAALRSAIRTGILRDGRLARLRATVQYCRETLRRLAAGTVPPGPRRREAIAEVEAELSDDAMWRLKARDGARRLSAEITAVAADELGRRLQRVRGSAGHGVAIEALARQAVDELTTVTVLLGGRAEDGLAQLAAEVAAALPVPDVPAAFTTRTTADSVHADPSPESVRRAAEDVLKGLNVAAIAGAASVPIARQLLQQAVMRGAVAGTVAAVGTEAAGAGVVSLAGAEAGAAGATTAAAAGAGGVALAASVIGVAVAVVVIGVVLYRSYRKLRDAQAADVCDIAVKRGEELTARTLDDLGAAVEQLISLVDGRLRAHRARLTAGEQERERQKRQGERVQEARETCERLLADLARAGTGS